MTWEIVRRNLARNPRAVGVAEYAVGGGTMTLPSVDGFGGFESAVRGTFTTGTGNIRPRATLAAVT